MNKKIFFVVLILMFLSVRGQTQEFSKIPAIIEPASVDQSMRISMDFENVPLKEILKALSRQTGANFIASDAIQDKSITVYFTGLTVDQALTSMLDANELSYDLKEDNIYIVKPAGTEAIKKETRVYKLNYLQVYEMAAISSGEGFSGSGGSATLGDIEKQSIVDILTALISPYGKISVETRSNAVIITDIPDVFEQIEYTLKCLDVRPLQVMLEVEIIETSTTALKNIGIKYGTATVTGGWEWGAGDAGGQSMVFPSPFPFTDNFVKEQFGATGMAAADLFEYGTITQATLQIILQLFAKDTDTKILSRPRVLTLNNEGVVFKASSNSAVGTKVVSVTQTQQEVTEAERYETGIILKAIPQINSKGDIFMFLEPSIARTQLSAFGDTFYDPQVRSSRSIVMVREGETIVIAGLIQTNNEETLIKVPFLGDIPLIGEVFRDRNKNVIDTEVIIFVTPRIIGKEKVKEKGKEKIIQQKDERESAMSDTLSKYKKEGKINYNKK